MIDIKEAARRVILALDTDDGVPTEVYDLIQYICQEIPDGGKILANVNSVDDHFFLEADDARALRAYYRIEG
jgi:hypothetical protein